MAKIVFFTAVAIAMLIVLGNSLQVKYEGKHRKEKATSKGDD